MVFDKKFSNVERINLLERWILFHSYVYYEKNDNIVSDSIYDKNAHTLAVAINKYPRSFSRSRYKKFFEDYDGNTGMDLVEKIKRSNKLVDLLEFDYNMSKNF
jgi:NAD-dependent DNA ligase